MKLGIIYLLLLLFCTVNKQENVESVEMETEATELSVEEFHSTTPDSLEVEEMLAIIAQDSIENETIQLLRTGIFHGDEVEEGIEQQDWLAVFSNEKTSSVRPVNLQVLLVEDPVVDEPGTKTGKEISIQSGEKPTFLVQGVEPISTEIQSLPITDSMLNAGSSVTFLLHEQQWKLTALGTKGEVYPTGSYFYELAHKNTRQIIAGTPFLEDANFSIRWAGDLDGDQALDLLLNVSNHYNVEHLQLYLSSFAKPGKLVQAVAERISVGC